MPPLSQQTRCRKFDIDLLDRLGASTITTGGMPQTLHGSTRPKDAIQQLSQQAGCRKLDIDLLDRLGASTITTSGMRPGVWPRGEAGGEARGEARGEAGGEAGGEARGRR